MKTIILIAVTLALVLCMNLLVTGCGNMDLIDTTYSYERAMVKLPDGTVVEGEVESWRDYEASDQLQVTIDGITYLTHAENVVMISDD